MMSIVGPIISFLAPIAILGYLSLTKPDYFSSLYSDPIGIWLTIGMLLWDGIGLAINLKFPSIVIRVIVFFFFTMPLLVSLWLMPTVVTMTHALSPMLK